MLNLLPILYLKLKVSLIIASCYWHMVDLRLMYELSAPREAVLKMGAHLLK